MNQRSMELLIQGRDLPWLLRQWVQRTPSHTALIWAPPTGEHQQWSYAQLDADIQKVAAALRAQGLTQGQRLLLHMDNCPEYLITYFACAYIGVVSVLTNTRCVSRELAYFCELTDIAGAVVHRHYLNAVQQAAPSLPFITVVDSTEKTSATQEAPQSQQPSLQKAAIQKFATPKAAAQKQHPFSQWLSQPAPSAQQASIANPMADLRIQFTSGTTSRPKAVLSTHANAIFAAQQTAQAYGLTSNDICQVFVPLFHNNGLSTLVTSALWAGGTVLLQPKFSASHFWPAALEYQASWASLPGAFFINALWSLPIPKHRFRFWMIGAVVPEVGKHFKLTTRGHWGMTEMISLPLVGDPNHNGPSGNIGRPMPGIELAIRDQQGRDCQAGETGRLYIKGIRGITLFKEYFNNPEANQKAFDAEGWFDTGDRITIGEQGDLFFADRDKDMLRVGGENVAASEIETVIRQLAWVKECAVVSQKHPMLDEVPVAFISLHNGAPNNQEQALITHCKQQLADFKVVRAVYTVKDFPRAALQKIAKHKLSEKLPELKG